MAHLTKEIFDETLRLRKLGFSFYKIEGKLKISKETARDICTGKKRVTCDFLGRPLPDVFTKTKMRSFRTKKI